jgi:hypothetical protein
MLALKTYMGYSLQKEYSIIEEFEVWSLEFGVLTLGTLGTLGTLVTLVTLKIRIK